MWSWKLCSADGIYHLLRNGVNVGAVSIDERHCDGAPVGLDAFVFGLNMHALAAVDDG